MRAANADLNDVEIRIQQALRRTTGLDNLLVPIFNHLNTLRIAISKVSGVLEAVHQTLGQRANVTDHFLDQLEKDLPS